MQRRPLTLDAASRVFAPDVHLPLSDSHRRHRARALARLRARRRALAAAAAAGGPRPTSLTRHGSDSSADADDGDGGDENDKRSAGTGPTIKSDHVDANGGDASLPCGNPPADSTGVGNSSSSGCGSISVGVGGSTGGNSSSVGSTTNNASSKVGDLFELMRNVSANAAAAALAAEGERVGGGGGGGGGGGRNLGEAVEGRELGRPVKYKYRQEAARSRKRTRGRFVSEKAPAFVSITELMALRRAERERQQQDDVAPVFVGAG